jgi:hypothetical protein
MAALSNNGNGNGSNSVTLSVRSLVNNRSLTKPQRAFLAKRVKQGEVTLELTDKLIAAACGVSIAYMMAAERCTDRDEFLINQGIRPLIWPKDKKPALVVPETDDQLDDIAHRVGPERLWDALQRAL